MRDIVSLKIVDVLKVQRRYWRMNTNTRSDLSLETRLKYKRNEIITFNVGNSHMIETVFFKYIASSLNDTATQNVH